MPGFSSTGMPLGPEMPKPPPPPTDTTANDYIPLPEQERITGADGSLQSKYKLTGQPNVAFKGIMGDENARLGALPQLNNSPLQSLEQYGQGTGDSPWAQAQLQQEQLLNGQRQGAAGSQAQSTTQNAMDNVAAHGGLSTGAAERIGTAGNNSMLAAKQGVAAQDQQANLGIRSTDAQNRLGVLENLPGQEVQSMQPALQEQSLWQQAAEQNQSQGQNLDLANRQYNTGVDQYNLANSIGQVNANNSWNQNKWQTQMQEKGAEANSAAEANRGKK